MAEAKSNREGNGHAKALPALLRRHAVRDELGLTDWQLRKIIDAKMLTPVYLTKDKSGKGTGYAYYKRAEVLKLAT